MLISVDHARWRAKNGRTESTPPEVVQCISAMPEAIFKNYQDLKWTKIVPALGESSPEICILRKRPGAGRVAKPGRRAAPQN
jgi:hypothetical protein